MHFDMLLLLDYGIELYLFNRPSMGASYETQHTSEGASWYYANTATSFNDNLMAHHV